MVRGTRHWAPRILSPRFIECVGRSRNEERTEDGWLEALDRSFRVDSNKVEFSSGSFHVIVVRPTVTIRELAASTGSSENQRIGIQLERPSGICFSPIRYDKSLSIEIDTRSSCGSDGMSLLAKPTMVSDVGTTSVWFPADIPFTEQSSISFWNESHPLILNGTLSRVTQSEKMNFSLVFYFYGNQLVT